MCKFHLLLLTLVNQVQLAILRERLIQPFLGYKGLCQFHLVKEEMLLYLKFHRQ
ncbi:hypothetical protein EVA_06168 [gut metagenome]|uniref:Uncharacterized protein n=1 Tax=gut metagenome TaxID=749906 RepID=J9GSR6_9ZZZZ